jgi:methionine-rich copper-binding protein CopC
MPQDVAATGTREEDGVIVPGPHRRWRRWWVALVAGCALSAVAAAPAAAADNELVVADPGVREQVDRPPGFVTMAFRDPVDPSLAKMLVQDASGANVTTGELIVEGTNMSSQLVDGLPQGTYTVTYRLGRSDGQPQGGTFQFSYGAGTFTDDAERTWSGTEDEPEVLRNTNPNAVTPAPPPSDEEPGTRPPSTSVTTLDPTPTDPASVPPSASAGPSSAVGGGTGTPGPSSAPAADAGPSTGALALGAVLLLVLVAAGVAVLLRRRATGRHEG